MLITPDEVRITIQIGTVTICSLSYNIIFNICHVMFFIFLFILYMYILHNNELNYNYEIVLIYVV